MAKLDAQINIGMKWHAFIIRDLFFKFREVDILSIDLERKSIKVIDIITNEVIIHPYTKKYTAEYTLAGVLELEQALKKGK